MGSRAPPVAITASHDACFGGTTDEIGWSSLGALNNSGTLSGFNDSDAIPVEDLAHAWLSALGD